MRWRETCSQLVGRAALIAHPSPPEPSRAFELQVAIDRLLKPRIYAAAGVPECRAIDVNDSTVLRRTGPVGERYTHVETLGRDDRVSLAVFPDVVIALAAILPE